MTILANELNMGDGLKRVPATELKERLNNFRTVMDREAPGWEIAVIKHKINMYYFSGTMQDGVLVVRPHDAVLWVRRSYERACNESLLPDIRPMKSFRNLAEFYQPLPQKVYLEMKTTTLEWQKLFSKYLPFAENAGMDNVISELRLVKSSYELALMQKSGDIHRTVLDELAPRFIVKDVSEAELAVNLYAEMLRRGSHGIARFNLALGEEAVGLASFGKSGLVKTAFDGPGGTGGTCVAVQSIGSAFRKLKAGQLVYLDIPCGVDGYNTDKTVVYYYGDLESDPFQDKIRDAYEHCLFLEQLTASLLLPDAVIEDVYQQVMAKFDYRYESGFMNGGKFLGHSIGMVMDEPPAIAKGFKDRLKPGMVFAIEPKIALPGIGLVGTENTYVITEQGAKSLTGKPQPLRCII